MRLVCRLGLLAGLFVLMMPAFALQFTVNSTADLPDANPGDGLCRTAQNTCTLRAAIMEANATVVSDSIVLNSGTYTLTRPGMGEDFASTGDLDIRSAISIIGSANARPVINGGNIDRVFDVHSGGSLVLNHVNVIGGLANTAGTLTGGGFRVRLGGRLFLSAVDVSANIANVGGAIYSRGEVAIAFSRFFNNVLVEGPATLELRDGTAIRSYGHLIIRSSTFHANGVIPGGGSALLPDRHVIVSSATASEQSRFLGIINSTFYGNTKGIRSDKIPTEIAGSSLVNNGASGLEFIFDNLKPGDKQLEILRTVIYGHANDCNGLPPSADWLSTGVFNASSDTTCGFSGTNGFENIVYPFNGGLADHGGFTPTLMPKSFGILVDPPGSDCASDLIQQTAAEDQREFPRPLDGNGDGTALCDIGAVEFNRDTDPVLTDGLFSDRFELSD